MADELNKKKPDLGSGSSSESAPKQAPTPKAASNPKQSSFNAPKKTPEQPKQVAKPQPVAKPAPKQVAQPKAPKAPEQKPDSVRQKILNQGFGPTQQQRLDSHNKLLGRVSQKYPSGIAGSGKSFMYDNYQEGDYDQPNNAFGIHTNGKGPRRSNWIEQNPDGSYKYSYREGTHDGKEVIRDNLDDDGVMGVFDEIHNGIVGGGSSKPASQKSAPEPAWNYPTDAEKNGNFNYSEARKNGFKHPTTGKESSDLYFKNNYTGPGYSAFEGLQPMKDPNDFSQKFEESFHTFPSEENDFKGRPMVGKQKFYEDDDDNVWDALREAGENASDTDTVRDVISRASKEYGIDEDRLLNALMFQHFYFGSDFAFSPESNYKKVAERQNEDYKKYLPKEQPPKGHQPSDRDEDYERSWGPEPDKDEEDILDALENQEFIDINDTVGQYVDKIANALNIDRNKVLEILSRETGKTLKEDENLHNQVFGEGSNESQTSKQRFEEELENVREAAMPDMLDEDTVNEMIPQLEKALAAQDEKIANGEKVDPDVRQALLSRLKMYRRARSMFNGDDNSEREQASKLYGTDLSKGKEPEPGEPGYSWKNDVLKNPELLEGDIVSMMEQEPDKYDYDSVEGKDWNEYSARKRNIRNDLANKLVSEEGFTPEEANQVLDAYLGTEEEDKQAWKGNEENPQQVENDALESQIQSIEAELTDLENRAPYGLSFKEQQRQKELENKLNELQEKRQKNSDSQTWSKDDEPGSNVVTKKLVDFTRDYLIKQGFDPLWADSIADNLHKDHATADFYRKLMKKKSGK